MLALTVLYICVCTYVCVGHRFSLFAEASCSRFQVCGSVYAVPSHSIRFSFCKWFEPKEAGVGMLEDINPLSSPIDKLLAISSIPVALAECNC